MKKGILFCLFMCGWLLRATYAQDLIIDPNEFLASSTKHAGGEAVVRYEVKNIGTQTVSQNTTVRFWLSADTILDNNDYQFPVMDQVGILSPQNSDDENAYLIIPVTQAPGNYYILIQADANDEVAETNEGNNVKHTPITVTTAKPDLSVYNPNVPASLVVGQTLTAQVTYENTGSLDAPPARLAVYASANNTFEAGTDVLLGSVDMPGIGTAIADRIRQTINTTNPWPTSITGSAYVLIVADDNDQVNELNETVNNVQARAIAIAAANADLRFASTSLSSTGVVAGQSVTANATVQNQGTTLAQAHDIRYYLSGNSTLDGNDFLLQTVNQSTLAAGGSRQVNTPLAIPEWAEGNYFIIYEINRSNPAGEPASAQGNNIENEPITVTAPEPDLSLVDLWFVASGTSQQGLQSVANGERFTINWQAQNVGTGAVSSYFVEFWLSTNNSISVFSDEQLDTGFGSTVTVNNSVSGSASIQIPTGFVSSNRVYYLIAKIVGTSPFESNEANNIRSLQIEIRPNSSGGAPAPGGGPTPGGSGVTAPRLAGPGLEQASLQAGAFSLSTYPNPAQGSTTVSLGAVGNYNVQLVDAQGRQVMQRQVQNANSTKLDLAGLQKGIYLLKAQGTAGIKTQRLVVH